MWRSVMRMVGVARSEVDLARDPRAERLDDLAIPGDGERHVGARLAQRAARGQRRVERELGLLRRQPVAAAGHLDRDRPAERGVVALLEAHDSLAGGEAADVEVAGLGAGRDPRLLGGGGRGEGEQKGEGGEQDGKAHGRLRVAAQAASARGFARFARRRAGVGLSRKPSSSAHVVPAAARPVSTPRWPPGAVASSTSACGSRRLDVVARPRPARSRRRGPRSPAPGP